MDALAGLLDGPRAKGAFLIRSRMNPPWSVQVRDEAPLTLLALTSGDAHVTTADGEAHHLRDGDIALLRGPDPYVVADGPKTPAHWIIHPDQSCTTLDGTPVHNTLDFGVRSWGNAPDGGTGMLIGTYRVHNEVSRRVLASLPVLVVVTAEQLDSPLPSLLGAEITRDAPGQDVVLDRLLDLLLIAVLRAWFGRADAPVWYRAWSDPVVGRAMRLMHAEVARPWTVATLAAETGVSRATLARRFTDMAGEPPMSFLADLRLTLAADRLREPDATVGSVAREVGYGSPFALSTAFKRARGVSPREFRQAAMA
ncbi:AraC family transcriptional regulator [Phytomonospora endophytica]|uniref:AraC-like DNA-binding protein n=1 Tax=Phytomonospora endophytica TaxID=714109 RepID=A0A841FP58_9ACTN|nr:AraC family transcriptional regulator [Phytomonospora endophytica]MBB6034369.1 AraC-like DNA-binding protein [Phytomonospora endophytica]GIG66762.1 AraC family transcriptional regulator [Phytomonospora endophytica]